MSKSKHTEAQMIEALKQVEAGRSAEEVGRARGVTKYPIYARMSPRTAGWSERGA